MCNQMLRNFYSSCTIRVICLGHAGEVVVQTPYILKVSKRDTHICYLLKRLGRYRNFILNVPFDIAFPKFSDKFQKILRCNYLII